MIKLTVEQIKKVAEMTDKGYKCFVKLDNGKLVYFPDQIRLPAVDMDEWDEAIAEVEENLDDYEEITAMDENQQYGIMEEFADQINDKKLRDRLYSTLDSNRPQYNFKWEIESADATVKNNWAEFKVRKGMEWVEEELEYINEKFENEED
ncbi:MAG: UPF0158 family protein [Cyclobacteriaceae bacterium]